MITVGYIKQNLDHLDDDLLMYSSDYTREYTIELFNKGYINMFNPIIGIYYSDGELVSDYSFDNNKQPETLGELHSIIEQYDISYNKEIGRYIEDGYVYSDYEHCFYNDKVIVFA